MSEPPLWYNPEAVEKLKRVSTATLTTQLLKSGFRSRFIRNVVPLRTGVRMVGYARTLRYTPMREDVDTLESLGGRNNAQRQVVEDVGPGEVLVIDAMASSGAGSLGNILALRLQVRGAAGIVTDGAFRDSPSIRQLSIPTYAAGQNANSNITLFHPADYDVPIGCGGVYVEPRDAVVGDDEGVVVIPAHLVMEVAVAAEEQEIREDFIYEEVGKGASVLDVYPMNRDAKARFDRWSRIGGGNEAVGGPKGRRTPD